MNKRLRTSILALCVLPVSLMTSGCNEQQQAQAPQGDIYIDLQLPPPTIVTREVIVHVPAAAKDKNPDDLIEEPQEIAKGPDAPETLPEPEGISPSIVAEVEESETADAGSTTEIAEAGDTEKEEGEITEELADSSDEADSSEAPDDSGEAGEADEADDGFGVTDTLVADGSQPGDTAAELPEAVLN